MSSPVQVWSCGGGTQSAAIAALIVQGRLPKPDLSVMVDTERERTSTWEYAHGTLIPALDAVGVTLEIAKKSDWATVDLYAGNGDRLLPMVTATGKLPGFCSDKWKRRVIQRWLRDCGVEECEVWMGISTDEMSRVRAPKERWFQERYPLIYSVPMRRSDCIALVASMGWPAPPRSACWMCPNASDREWKEMKRDHPADFDAAVMLEREVRQNDPDIYLHRSGQTLDLVDFDAQLDLYEDSACTSGYCFV